MESGELHPLQIKAIRGGFTIVPDPEAPFETILAVLEKRLEESREFFKNGSMSLDLRERALNATEIAAIHGLLLREAGIHLSEIVLTDELSFHGSPEEASRKPATPVRPITPPQAVEEIPVVIKTTCRSGARVVSPSDCVVLGDVNPGAEIVAAGDVVVFGSLRGMAHAGATGDRTAKIWAISIEPNQLRIADFVAVPPKGARRIARRYEIAEIQGDGIEVTTI